MSSVRPEAGMWSNISGLKQMFSENYDGKTPIFNPTTLFVKI
jgi:hypothetical protein